MSKETLGGDYKDEEGGIRKQDEINTERKYRSSEEYHVAMKWVLSRGFRSQSTDYYQKALEICDKYSFPDNIRHDVLFDWYRELVNEDRIEEAEKFREEHEIVAKRFPMTTKEYLTKKEVQKQEEVNKARQMIKESLEKTGGIVNPSNQFRQAIRDDNLEQGLSLFEKNPELIDIFLREVIILAEKSFDRAYRWSEASNNPKIQQAVFKALFDYFQKQGRQDMITKFYHGVDYETDLIKSEVEDLISSGNNLRMAVKLAQIIGGNYEKEVGQHCMEKVQPWENSLNRYERAKYNNLVKLIAGNAYH